MRLYAMDAQLTASQVLRTFHRDELSIFLGAAFTTVGLVTAAFAALARKVDALLIWFALFSFLYGQRLWMDLGMLPLILPPSAFFISLRTSVNYLVPIPAVFYFEAAGFLGRYGKKVAYALAALYLSLFGATLAFGPRATFAAINNIVVIALLVALVGLSMRKRVVNRDFIILRRGALVFAGFALATNVANLFGHYFQAEALGFAFLLGSLGYVAARRTLHRDVELAQIQKELEVARRIQMENLPSAYPNSAHFRVATGYVPMTSVAGDFYDFLVAEPHRAGLLVADVSGHGVPAALIASMVKLAASLQRDNASDPATLLKGMNVALCGNTQNQFVTAAYVHLDATSRSLRYSAAGHPPLLLLRDGRVTAIEENGLMLAAFPYATFTTAVHALEPGDRIVMYTDGVLEAADEQMEEFGQERLQALLRNSGGASPQEMVNTILSSVQAWAKSQDDDLTVLVCEYAAG